MATEKETPAVETVAQVVQPEPPQTKTLTQEEVERIRQEAEETAYKKLQRAQTKLANENLALKKQLSQQSGKDKITRQIIEEVKPDLLPEYDKETQYTQWQQQVEDRRGKLEDQIVKAGFSPEDEKFEGIFDLFETAALSGRFDRVEDKLNRTLAKLKPVNPIVTPVTPKETEEERIKRLVEEGTRKSMEERGLLISETGIPSGQSRTWTRAEFDAVSAQPDGWKILEKEFGPNFGWVLSEKLRKGEIK